MSIEKVLVAEPDVEIREALTAALKGKKCEVIATGLLTHALELMQNQQFDLVMCSNELNLFKSAKELQAGTPIVLLTTFAGMRNAVEAMRQGAFGYLIKPFSNDALDAMLDKVQEHEAIVQENQYLRQEISYQEGEKKNRIIAESALMKKLLEDVVKIAQSNASVFISGESGTGKEVIAQAIHDLSERSKAAFVKVNCAAIPEALIEAEFFGHEKGSFTGAHSKRLGRFELADKGTLLLDEISEVSLPLQSKLLRVVQEQEFERVGGVRPICVDVRLISTSNRNMKEAIEQKIFREDLFYRLNVVPIYLAPLRERQEDIIPLAEYFLEQLCKENHKPRKTLSAEAKTLLLNYPWPGNIRQLANIIERTTVMNAANLILPEHLGLEPTYHTPTQTVSSTPLTLRALEKKHILETLLAHNQNRTRTAKVLGISIRTLRNKLKEYRIQSAAPE
jgi:two-component system, NtrC family, response regulator AtoC